MSWGEWFRCLRGFHEFKFIRNIYGDEINQCNGRSFWRCGNCGKIEYRPDLFIRKPNIPETKKKRKK